jgi:hypothetical protein
VKPTAINNTTSMPNRQWLSPKRRHVHTFTTLVPSSAVVSKGNDRHYALPAKMSVKSLRRAAAIGATFGEGVGVEA